MDDIESLYRLRVVDVMGKLLPSEKTAALEKLAKEVFADLRFDAFKTDMGIVGTRWEDDRPMIFKTNGGQAFTRAGTFEPRGCDRPPVHFEGASSLKRGFAVGCWYASARPSQPGRVRR